KAMDGNAKDTAPVVVVPKPNDRSRWDALPSDKKDAQKKIDDRREVARDDFKAWMADKPHDALVKGLPADKMLFHALLADDQASELFVTVGDQVHTVGLKTN